MENKNEVASAQYQVKFDLQNAEIQNPDNLRSVYSNNAAIMATPHDFRVIFSEIWMSGPADRQPKVELRASVTMAPTQFKAFALAVAQTLKEDEARTGEIPWPPKAQ